MKGPMRVHYDEEADFLEVSIGRPTPCYASEIEPGIFLRIDEKTKDVKSIGILGFKKRSKQLKDINFTLPVEMSLKAIA